MIEAPAQMLNRLLISIDDFLVRNWFPTVAFCLTVASAAAALWATRS
jgi:hypothetical protein